MKHTIRNLLFDLGNVIIDIDIDGAYQRLQGLMREDVDMNAVKKALTDYECGHISTEIFINHMLRQCNHKVQALDVIEAWNSMLLGIPRYRLTMLEMLRPAYSVYLLSNTNALHLEWVHRYVQRTFKISNFEDTYFDTAFYSHLLGDRKPNASIFQRVSEEAFMTPDRTLFMDDTLENIEVAKSLGFHTHHVEPGQEIAEFLKLQEFY